VLIIFCSDQYLLEINKKYLGRDYLTDIITFSYNSEETTTGELYISIERVKENSKLYSQSFVNELHRVIFHGILHLVGYCDENDKEKEEMRKKEEQYLDEFKFIVSRETN
jgi:rRNA maturation RNase YbeY